MIDQVVVPGLGIWRRREVDAVGLARGFGSGVGACEPDEARVEVGDIACDLRYGVARGVDGDEDRLDDGAVGFV